MISILIILLLIPLFVGIGLQAGKRRAREQARRLEEYRASPKSHLLNLRD